MSTKSMVLIGTKKLTLILWLLNKEKKIDKNVFMVEKKA